MTSCAPTQSRAMVNACETNRAAWDDAMEARPPPYTARSTRTKRVSVRRPAVSSSPNRLIVPTAFTDSTSWA